MIENPKIAALRPDGPLFRRWDPAAVHGVSLLYTPPGHSTLFRRGHQVLHCDLGDPRVALYSALSRMVESLDGELRHLDPCWLEPSSYHSTFASSVNDFTLDRTGGANPDIRRFIRDLPGSLTGPLPEGLPPARIGLNRPWRVRFRCGGLEVWPDDLALVARLEAADEESRTTLDELHALRGALNHNPIEHGTSQEAGPVPHVTLCYFATREQAGRASEWIANAGGRELSSPLQNLVIEHGSISLYGWTSMLDFWPHRLYGDWTDIDSHAAQSAIVRSAHADPDHALDRLLRLMRENSQAALYLFGSRLDNDFCFGSGELGALLSVLPEDSSKAGVPGYHPGSTEVYVTFQGQLTMDCMELDLGRVLSTTASRDDIVVLPPGRCHRIRNAAGTNAASLVVKTNLAHHPGVVRCDRCQYFSSPEQCALHNEWRAETG